MEQYQSDRKGFYLFLLVLLIHTLFLFFILNRKGDAYISLEQKMQELLEKQKTQQLTPQEKKELFKWLAGESQGASVLFEDQDEIGQTEELPTSKVAKQKEKKESPTKEKVEEKKETTQADADIQEEKPRDLGKKPEPTTLADIFEPKKPKSKTEDAADTIDTAQTQSDKPKVSLADITQGLMKKIGQKSEHFVNALSNERGQPTDQQIKIERYLSKIQKCAADSQKIYYQKMADIVHSNKNNKENMVTSYMVFSLDRKGKLINLYTAQSCGIKELDEMILYIFKHASSSFPPIPSYITIDPFEFCIVYNIQLKQDQPNFRFTMN